MKKKYPHLKTQSMRKILLITVLSVFTTLFSYGQCPDPPSVDSEQFFCSETAWLLIGETADYLSDLQVFPDQVGWTITWYEDDNGMPGVPIANPSAELLVNGAVYHVTQTDAANCESDPLMITLTERDCACIKDPTFEDQNGNPSARGYNFVQFQGIQNHKTCAQSMAGAPPLPMGTIDGYGPNDDAVLVTPGIDPPHIATGGGPNGRTTPLTRTNPNNPASAYGLRVHRGAEYGGPGGTQAITAMRKDFIAGEVFVFNFALVLQNPNHQPHEQPFAQIRLYDMNDNVLQERCLISDPNDCIFNIVGTGTQMLLYSDWSCMKLNTFDYIGEPLRAEITVAYCTPTQHYAFIYVDDIYVGDDNPDVCGNSAFGYALLDTITPLGGECFIPEQNLQAGVCFSGVSGSVPGFPLEVCGIFDAPISQGPPPKLEDMKLNIVHNNVVVGTVDNPTISGGRTFCFTIDETDINVLPYGDFQLQLELEYELDCGAAYNFYIDERSSVTVSPRAGCPEELRVCDSDGSGISTFDLTEVEPLLYNNIWTSSDMTLSYYESEQDAHDAVNAIANPTSYQNTVPGGQIIYVRIDWTLPDLPSNPYYLAELPLSINPLPDLTELEDVFVACTDPFTITLSGVPANLEDMGDVTYKWYRNGTQLASSASYYDATLPGTYTVVVSNFDCESTHDFEIIFIEYNVDLGGDQRVICDGSPATLTADVTPGTNTPPIDIDDVDFLWSTGETTQTITVTQSGIYTVDVTYEGCTQTKTIEVLIGNPQVDLGPEVVLCELPSAGILLEPEVTGVPENEVTYEWSTGETTPTITVTDFGTYSVDIIWNGCVATATKTIRQATAPEITLGEDFEKCSDDEVTLEVTFLEDVEGALTYTWFLDGVSIAGDGPSIVVTDFGTYKVVVDNEGCIAEETVTISPYAINPDCIITEGISPDGSPGFNDYLDLSFLASRTGIEKLQIFNRYGMIVYEKENYTNEWEGQTTDGDKLPTGVYYYVLNLSGDDPVFGNHKAGWIYLNRGIN